MKVFSINTGFFKLDGGAMFGVVPKSIWNSLNPSDENNMCSWALRCLLIDDGKRRLLIDNGLGDKQSSKFFGFLYLHGDDSLEKSLAWHGYQNDDITDMVLTHLHFDHCGGSIRRKEEGDALVPAFKNATYWSHSDHWQWATQPNAREKASFLTENILPIRESGRLKFLDEKPGTARADQAGLEIIRHDALGDDISFIVVRGHTDAMVLPVFRYRQRTIIYAADLIPSAGHIPVPYVMAYDTRPLVTMVEKAAFLDFALSLNAILFFEHDPETECCSLKQTPRGIRMDKAMRLEEI